MMQVMMMMYPPMTKLYQVHQSTRCIRIIVDGDVDTLSGEDTDDMEIDAEDIGAVDTPFTQDEAAEFKIHTFEPLPIRSTVPRRNTMCT